ncbi:DUF3718 domain-containing protein [Alteromonas sediminis]|uniref:DUF3718 domain-containing protein n=1 Tax=Alteromonas sediminis TaxID=2259342 RepID=A0A3N5XZ42_9ALTE|nr:DUF3718 domain-containing protein [Alteromonas sediminis]RPJ65773.1 DUF3718 domain-containing protein [Alteromonas sediminis]
MKKFAAIAISSLFTIGLSTQASADVGMPKYLEKQLVSVCHALKNDDKLALKKIIRKAHFDYDDVVTGLKCNGQNAHEYALLNGASDTANYIAKRAGLDMSQVVAKR